MSRGGYQKSSLCTQRGLEAEQTFKTIMEARGWACTEASEHENKMEHWDIKCSRLTPHGTVVLRVDVKAPKKNARSDAYAQELTTWIECKGEYHNGWLWSPNATHIAFEQEKAFILVPLLCLQQWFKTTYAEQIQYTNDMSLAKQGTPYAYRRVGKKNEGIVIISYEVLAALPKITIITKPNSLIVDPIPAAAPCSFILSAIPKCLPK